jgi:hypothetical protein
LLPAARGADEGGRRRAALARTASRPLLQMLIECLGTWLAAGYTAVHRRKTPR